MFKDFQEQIILIKQIQPVPIPPNMKWQGPQ